MAFRAGSTIRFAITNDYVAHRVAAAPSWRWSEVAGVPIAALSMLSLTLAIASTSWTGAGNPTSAVPFALASMLLLSAADLIFEPRQPWSRSRNNAVMNSACVGFLMVLLFCVASAGWFAWAVLYPLLLFPLSLAILPALGIGIVSRLPLPDDVRRQAVLLCLTAAGVLGTLGSLWMG